MPNSFKPMVSTDSGRTFATNALRFATKEEAEASARELMMRWMAVTDTRADESDDPVNYRFEMNRNIPLMKDAEGNLVPCYPS